MDDALYRQQDGLLSGGQVFSFRKQDEGFCLHFDFRKVSGFFLKIATEKVRRVRSTGGKRST